MGNINFLYDSNTTAAIIKPLCPSNLTLGFGASGLGLDSTPIVAGFVLDFLLVGMQGAFPDMPAVEASDIVNVIPFQSVHSYSIPPDSSLTNSATYIT